MQHRTSGRVRRGRMCRATCLPHPVGSSAALCCIRRQRWATYQPACCNNRMSGASSLMNAWCLLFARLAAAVCCVYVTISLLSQDDGDLVKGGVCLADLPATFSC